MKFTPGRIWARAVPASSMTNAVAEPNRPVSRQRVLMAIHQTVDLRP